MRAVSAALLAVATLLRARPAACAEKKTGDSKFDEAYASLMRKQAVKCRPHTGDECSEREKDFLKRKEALDENALRGESVRLHQVERGAALSEGQTLWLDQRHNIIDYLLSIFEHKRKEVEGARRKSMRDAMRKAGVEMPDDGGGGGEDDYDTHDEL